MTKEAFGKFLTSFIALHLLLLLCKQHHHTPHFWRSELLVFSKLVDNISPPVLSSPSDSRPIHDMFLVYHAARLAGYCLPSPELDLIMKTHMKTLFFGDELPTTSQKTYRKWILAGGISATHFSKEHQQRNKRDDRTQDSPYRDASPPGNRCKKSKIRWRIWQAEPTLKLLFVTYVSNEMDHERFAWQLCKLIKKAVPHTEEPEGDEAQHMLTGTRSWVEKKLQALDSNIISVFDTAKHIFIHMKDELRTLFPSFIKMEQSAPNPTKHAGPRIVYTMLSAIFVLDHEPEITQSSPCRSNCAKPVPEWCEDVHQYDAGATERSRNGSTPRTGKACRGS